MAEREAPATARARGLHRGEEQERLAFGAVFLSDRLSERPPRRTLATRSSLKFTKAVKDSSISIVKRSAQVGVGCQLTLPAAQALANVRTHSPTDSSGSSTGREAS